MKNLELCEILVHEHDRMLYAYVLGFVHDQAAAQDIVQQAFLKAFRNLDSLQNKSKFPAWLRSIARNLAVDYLRDDQRELATDPDILAGMEDIFSSFDDPGAGDTWQERIEAVRRCFQQLSKSFSSVLKLFYWDRMSTKSIAGRLDISLATVLKRLERGRKELRGCVESQINLAEFTDA